MSTYNLEQQLAADPEYSIWLHASAGTGKTKVLTDRLLRLLLEGVSPSKILCLTFTNAAANEMHERIYSKISQWAIADDQEIRLDLKSLGHKDISTQSVFQAKNLLQEYLQKEDELNIYTIHSFAQKVLKKFPIEAGLSPNFKIIDEVNRPQIISKIKHLLMRNVDLLSTNNSILCQMHEMKLNELISNILASQIRFKIFFDKCNSLAKYQEHLKSVLKIKLFDEDKLILEVYQSVQEFLGQSLESLGFAKDSIIAFGELKKIFLTQDGCKRKKISSKTLIKASQDTLFTIQEIIFKGVEEINAIKIYNSCSDFYNLAFVIIKEYESYKQNQGRLDYDDLIYHTLNLFTKSEYKDWILYKLDGGIDHILVDEAQDTSLYQWELIIALISDFISGQGDDRKKSIFVVGDEKQSIYSFQGARYEYFAQVKKKILLDLHAARRKYQTLNLKTSYRSGQVILDVVNNIFKHIRKIDESLFDINNFELDCHNSFYGGKVEFWKAYSKSPKEDLFWPVFSKDDAKNDPKNRLAHDIANYIAQLVNSKKVLFSTQKAVSFGDFMILFRQRGDLAQEIVSELKKLKIPVSGLDKMLLEDDLTVQDLLAAAKFSLYPDDELNLACLLRSPTFGLSEEELHSLTYDRSLNLYLHIKKNHLELAGKLDKINLLAQSVNITNFFHILVYGYNNLEKFIASNGYGAIDSIAHLIGLASKFEQEISGNMHEFIAWCSTYEIEISKDIASQNVVKIMTAHGAKGLQSPIVILPDTTKLPRSDYKFLWDEDEYPIFSINASNHNLFYKMLKEEAIKLDYKEYIRLLYVALTRAQEHLIICGYQPNSNIDPDSWYSISESSLLQNFKEFEIDGEKRFIYESDIPNMLSINQSSNYADLPLVNLQPEKEYLIEKKQLNSEVHSPLEYSQGLFHGQVIHKIFEDALRNKNLSLLQEHNIFSLLPIEYAELMKEKFKVLIKDEEFCELLDGDIKSEVAIADSNDYSFGIIDLLIMKENSIIIIDYKTDAKVPEKVQDAPPKYLEQVGRYKKMIQNIYPQKPIAAKILWLSGPKFMLID